MDAIETIRKRMGNTLRRQADELRNLLENPSLYAVALALVDAHLKGLAYLENYSAALDLYGEPVDMVELREQLEADVKKEFFRLTGRRYEYPASRDYAFRQEGPQT